MADAHVQVAADGSGKKIDNTSLEREPTTLGGTGDTVYRQRVVIGSDTDPKVQASPEGEVGRAALPVHSPVLDEIRAELALIRETLQLIIGN